MGRNFLYSRLAQGITAGLLLATLAAFWFFAVGAEQHLLRAGSDRMEEEELTIRRMDVQLGKILRADNTYRNNMDEIEQFRAQFLQQKDERLVRISHFLEETARNHQVQMEQVAYAAAPSREKDLEIQKVNLPLKGKYRDIRALVADIESSDLFLIISQMTLEGEQGDVVEVQLSLTTYFEGGQP